MLVMFTALLAALLVAALAAALAWGGPRDIAPLASINAPFQKADFRSVPPPQHYTARDGVRLAWHAYPAAAAAGATAERPAGRVVLVHGSSARAQSMHLLAQALVEKGYDVVALDMRGHGGSGPRGQAAYIGQLEDDVEDFLRAVPHAGPQTLMGFSAGGGFALRFAGSARQSLFDRYVLLAPYLHHNAPTERGGSGGWASVGIPRIVALAVLTRAGITRWNDLPVLRFALAPAARSLLTPSYSYTLATNFRPHDDYRSDIRQARGPLCILAGEEDELFHAERYAEVFAQAGKPVPVTLLPGVNHVGLTLDRGAVQAIAARACGRNT